MNADCVLKDLLVNLLAETIETRISAEKLLGDEGMKVEAVIVLDFLDVFCW